MSKKTISQMEAELMDKIEHARKKLDSLQQKHKLEIGTLAYKHGFNQFDMSYLDQVFSKIASEPNDGHN